jgi:transcriptional regulator with XRE-family HTH domain
MDEFVTEQLKERIRERMEKMGKNPSSVATEAGLSRSAVRDILSGKARNPGIMTIHHIADALECSHNYLMGYTDELHYRESPDILIDFFARTSDISGMIEAGVFRQLPTSESSMEFGHRVRKPLRSAHRYMYRDLYLYQMADDSLEGLNIVKGDLLTAVFDPTAEAAPNGSLVVVSHSLQGTNVEELSARIVIRHSRGFTLSTKSAAFGGTHFQSIEATEALEGFARFRTANGGEVFIEGVVVELTRQLDV